MRLKMVPYIDSHVNVMIILPNGDQTSFNIVRAYMYREHTFHLIKSLNNYHILPI